MRRLPIMAAILLLTAGAAPAARLCRDSKGLFTPCIGERPPAAPHARRHDDAPATTAEQGQPARADRPVRERATRTAPPLVAKTRLCRDSKGLFTPCVR